MRPPRPIIALRRFILDRLVLRPSKHVIDAGRKAPRLATVNGRQIQYFQERVDDPFADAKQSHRRSNDRLLILKFPGTAGRAERSTAFPASLLHSVPANVLTWNPPGYGESEGRFSLSTLADTAHAWVEQVLEQQRSGSFGSEQSNRSFDRECEPAIWLVGNSLGCLSALSIASGALAGKVGGMVLRNPPPLIPVVKQIASRYPLGRLIDPVANSLPPSANAFHLAPQCEAPCVFLQSENDTLVPPDLQNRVFDLYGGEKRQVVLNGLEHDGIASDEHQEAIASAVNWLWKQSSVT